MQVVSGDLRGVAGDPAASLFSTAKLAFSGKLDLGKFTSTWRALIAFSTSVIATLEIQFAVLSGSASTGSQ